MLVSSKEMILKASRGGYAVGCFNSSDLEMTKAIVAAAEAQNAPVLVATSEAAIKYAGLEPLAAIIKEFAEHAKVPIALHLDHGASIQMIHRTLNEGYTSVMFDGSAKPFEENIALTTHAVAMAHHHGVVCEGELGHLGKAGESASQKTDPELVAEFIEKTGADFLAISIGSQHGIGGGESEKLDLDLLRKLKKNSRVPLVLHGASGVSEADIRGAIEGGIAKINIDTDIRQTFCGALKKAVSENINEPREILSEAMEEIQALIEAKIKLFGSTGKAKKKFLGFI